MQLPDLPRFYCPDAAQNKQFELEQEEAKHARVLRLTENAPIHVMDGKGQLFKAFILKSGKHTQISVEERLFEAEPNKNQCTLLVAPTKNINRFEWVVEKATELGVDYIIPIHCSNSERSHINVDRLMRIGLSAAKQSRSLFLPRIDPITPFTKGLELASESKWIAHCHEGNKTELQALISLTGPRTIAIGPEGDFSESEVQLAVDAGFKPLSLGSKRLRTETAAIVSAMAATIFQG